MPGPNTARAIEADPIAQAVADAPEDDREVTTGELEALREARADTRPFVSGADVTTRIAERARREG